MATVARCIQLKNNSYWAVKRQAWYGPFDTVSEAEEKRDEVERQQAPKPAGGALAKFYYDTYVPGYMKGIMRTNSIRGSGRIYEQIILPYFERKRIAEITPQDCMQFQIYLKAQERWAPITINGYMALLKVLFEKAIDLGIIEKNPCERIKNLKVEKVDRPTLTVAQILEVVKNIDHPYSVGVAIAGLSGSRESEVMGFKWEDFEFLNDGHSKIRWVRSINTHFEIDGLKSEHQYATLAMVDSLSAILKEYRKSCPDEEWLFQGKVINQVGKYYRAGYKYHRKAHPRKHDYASGLALSHWWRNNIRERFDFIDDKMRFHDLKHSFATNICEVITNIKDVQALCRHADVKTTLSVYAHHRPEQLEQTVWGLKW